MRIKKEKISKIKVLVAMSGGIDSSVAAALSKKKGFKVAGVFMKFWKPALRAGRRGSLETEARAREVAKILKIPFYVFNFEKEFKKRIVDYFLEELKKGNTPNPCVVCNKEIKFGFLIEKALKMGFHFVASGHYAKIEPDLLISDFQGKEKSLYKLLKAKDKEKDQSYFLWKLNQEQLKRILFPLGNFTKSEVKRMAKRFNLPVCTIKESQEICFIDNSLEEFLKKYIGIKEGRIINKEGKVLGEHKGLWFYTIGQRRGIKLPGGPYFVVGKDLKNNNLIVSKNREDLFRKEFLVKEVNWISGKEPKFPLKVEAKIRYRNKGFKIWIKGKSKGNFLIIECEQPQGAITPGQSAVFYKGRQLLGGGIIV